jgi:hypothetical protein
MTKAENAMKLSIFKEYLAIEQGMCREAQTRLLDIFKAGRGPCIKKGNLLSITHFKLARISTFLLGADAIVL